MSILICNNLLSSVNIGYAAAEITNYDSRILVSPNEVRMPVLPGILIPPSSVVNNDYNLKIGHNLSYVFTLSNATLEDSGLYLVTVTAMALHPATLVSTNIERKYSVSIRNCEH